MKTKMPRQRWSEQEELSASMTIPEDGVKVILKQLLARGVIQRIGRVLGDGGAIMMVHL